MAPTPVAAVATVFSSQAVHKDGSILVEAGGYAPTQWFMQHALRSPSEEEDTDDGPRTKRRKLEPRVNPVALREDPETHIPISRVTIHLHFSESLTSKPLSAEEILEDVGYPSSNSIAVVPLSFDNSQHSGDFSLRMPGQRGEVLKISTTRLDKATAAAVRWHMALQRPGVYIGGPRIRIHGPSYATFPTCTLTRSQGTRYTVVGLEFSMYWKSGFSVCTTGMPNLSGMIYPENKCLEDVFPDSAREPVGLQQLTPQYFYDSIQAPEKGVDPQEWNEDVLESNLYPFQKRAVAWMLRREGIQYKGGRAHTLHAQGGDTGFSLWKEARDLSGELCYVNHVQAIVARSRPSTETNRLSGGLLAEEMGLGKTVEVMALLMLNKRPDTTAAKVLDEKSGTTVRSSRATLIITPASILQQWISELAQHAPSLRVFHYKGISAERKGPRATQTALSEIATKYDVVLTSYQVLRTEVHFAEDPPQRNMRHAPKFERLRSPLVETQWWRVCLDEAQMVESGVSAAARVAHRVPRVHSWAVTGTPLRKDVQDLYGLLIFLRSRPLCNNPKLWTHIVRHHPHFCKQIFGSIAIRHTKAQIREDLQLPPQKRVVITMPFSAVEQQQYATLFSEMCEDVGVTSEGWPNKEGWDPNEPSTVEAMRTWLVRLRQTCLHPQVGGRNRRALGRGQGPLRTVAEVLEVMIEQNDTSVRTEQRNLLSSQLTKAHILGNNRANEHRSEEALEIYTAAMHTCATLVEESRAHLAAAKGVEEVGEETDDDVDEDSVEVNPVIGRLRNSLRTALQMQHICTFFAATAYYQIKSNEALTKPDSEEFKQLEEQESSFYERAKALRKELLRGSARKSEVLMGKIADLNKKGAFTKMPKLADLDSFGGIESRRILDKSDRLFDVLREQAQVAMEWRIKMSEYLLKALVDVDEGIEITGDEYEDSTKLQDELYAYFDALKAVQADMNTFVTGQDAPLIDHEVNATVKACKTYLDPNIADELKSQPHAPELSLKLYATRNNLRNRKAEVGSVRGLIQEARSLESSLQFRETGTRAAEGAIIHRHLVSLQKIFNSFTESLAELEAEVDLFRSTQNQRLEFYRQLQELSDAVKPYKEELDDKLDVGALQAATKREEQQAKSLAQLKTKNRFLLHLRTESGSQEGPRICVICQCPFENGVLTVCGHQYCKECIHHWWSQHRTCPVCKRRLALVDFHNITYKPQELRAQEENQSGASSSPLDDSSEQNSSPSRSVSIYSDIDSQVMNEIKSIDLPSSYGTKIDTLGRHLLWIRAHDPGAKSIVFSQYREFLDVLTTAFTSFKISSSRLGKPGAVERFKDDPSVECLLLDAKTDSSGLTLVNATHVFICEPLIQTAVELQAIARVHRIGQTRPTTVWMYLITDTVEEAIYEVSVARRLAHVQSRQTQRSQKSSRSATPAPLVENAIEAANSDELQTAQLSKLLATGKGGGELVVNDDLWKCLFGKVQKNTVSASDDMQNEVDRHLRVEAAEHRRSGASLG